MIFDLSANLLTTVISDVVDKCIDHMTTLSKSLISQFSSLFDSTTKEILQGDIEMNYLNNRSLITITSSNTDVSIVFNEIVPTIENNEVKLIKCKSLAFSNPIQLIKITYKLHIINPLLKYVSDLNFDRQSKPKVKFKSTVNSHIKNSLLKYTPFSVNEYVRDLNFTHQSKPNVKFKSHLRHNNILQHPCF